MGINFRAAFDGEIDEDEDKVPENGYNDDYEHLCDHCGFSTRHPDHGEEHHEWRTSQPWHTDWDSVDHIGGEHDELHRGMALSLPKHVHDAVHDESRPLHERAQALADHVIKSDDGHLGRFWSDEQGVSRNYATSTQVHRKDQHNDRGLKTPVLIHAHVPDRAHIETDPDELDHHGVYSYHLEGNKEVPLQHGTPMRLKGISWSHPRDEYDVTHSPFPDHWGESPDKGTDDHLWTRHDFSGGIKATSSAQREDDDEAQPVGPDADEPGEGAEGATEDPTGETTPSSCSYCGGTSFKDLTDNGRSLQATCAVCGGTMSNSGTQWTPELIGDPSNHPKPDPDPRSGGVGGAGAAAMDPLVRDPSRIGSAKPDPWMHNPDTHKTDWDQVYGEGGIGGRRGELHRGVAVSLPEDVHDQVHDELLPVHERANLLLNHLNTQGGGNIGHFWSDAEGVSRRYAMGAIEDKHRQNYRFLSTPVVVHAHVPDRSAIETDPDKLYGQHTMSYHMDSNREVPLRQGTPVHVKAISWHKPKNDNMVQNPEGMMESLRAGHDYYDDPSVDDQHWNRHDFAEPQQHTAAKTAEHWTHGLTDEEREQHASKEWDEIHSGLDEIHRGIGVHLPPELHKFVHDKSQPQTERAKALLHHVQKGDPENHYTSGGLGIHWSDRDYTAFDFAHRQADYLADRDKRQRVENDDFTHGHEPEDPEIPRGHPATQVILHAHEIPRDSINHDPNPNGYGTGEIYEHDEHGESEVPIHEGASLPIKGISFREHHHWADEPEGFNDDHERHDFPETQFHTAATDGPDWCAHRRNEHCFYPGNQTNLLIPQDRGPCPWLTIWAQAACPISAPGPMAVMRAQAAKEEPHTYLRFGDWPKNERSHNGVTGFPEEGVSVYELDHEGDPKDPDPHMLRGHYHDEHCDPDCDLDEDNDDFGNDTDEEMHGRVHRAERNRDRGHDLPSERAHLVKGEMVGLGHDAEPLLRNVRRVGDWIDHKHLFFPGAEPHHLARTPDDEDYEPPVEHPTHPKRAAKEPTKLDIPGAKEQMDDDARRYVANEFPYSHHDPAHQYPEIGQHLRSRGIEANFGNVDANTGRFADTTLSHLHDLYPGVLHSVDSGSVPLSEESAHASGGHITFNERAARRPGQLHINGNGGYHSGHFSAPGALGIIAHEFGHSLTHYVGIGDLGLHALAHQAHPRAASPARAYDLGKKKISGYADKGGIDELTAEAFADHALHGKSAAPFSRAIAQKMHDVYHLKRATEGLRFDRSSSGFGQDHLVRAYDQEGREIGSLHHNTRDGSQVMDLAPEHRDSRLGDRLHHELGVGMRRLSTKTASGDEDYRIDHRAPGGDPDDVSAPLHDVESILPDFYTHPHYYNYGQQEDLDFHTSANVIRGARGNPEKKVRIYRALPAEHAHKGINTGDWVSTSKAYARWHGGQDDPKHDWPVISAMVPAKHLHTEGEVHEWGYNGPPKSGLVSFKGGYHQEIRHDKDGNIVRVKRRSKEAGARGDLLGEAFVNHFGIAQTAPPVGHERMHGWDDEKQGQHPEHQFSTIPVKHGGFAGYVHSSEMDDAYELGGAHPEHGGFDEDLWDDTKPEPTQTEEEHFAEHDEYPESHEQRHQWAYEEALEKKQAEHEPTHDDPELHDFIRYHGANKHLWHNHANVEHVDLKQPIYATQPNLVEKHLNRYLHNKFDMTDRGYKLQQPRDYDFGVHPPEYHGDEMPAFVKHEGRMHAIEGHHRVASELLRKSPRIRGRVFDADKHGFPPLGYDADDQEGEDHEDYQAWSEEHAPTQHHSALSAPETAELVKMARQDLEFGFMLTASWADVRNKAKRLRAEGHVRISVASNDGVAGEVKGDHGIYENVITYVPGSQKIADWRCGCKWAAYSWGRSGRYRKFEGRQCSHSLAMRYEAQSRGMFGEKVMEDTARPKWLKQRTPVTVEYDRTEKKNLNRRAVPPGNMKRTFEGSLVFSAGYLHATPANVPLHEETTAYCGEPIEAKDPNRLTYNQNDGMCPKCLEHLPDDETFSARPAKRTPFDPSHLGSRPVTAIAREMIDRDEEPADIMKLLMAFGLQHSAAKQVLQEALAGPEEPLQYEAAAEERHCPRCGAEVPADADRCPVCNAPIEDVPELHEASLHEAMEGRRCPHCGGYIGPLAEERHKCPHCGAPIGKVGSLDDHNTMDTRRHAPEFGKGVPDWGLPMQWCPQCSGSGCGHCGAVGQVLPASDASPSTTVNPVPDQNSDMGPLMSGGITQVSALGPNAVEYREGRTWTGNQNVTAHLPNGERIGELGWHPEKKHITWVAVYDDEHRRKGVASGMLAKARQIDPEVHHNDLNDPEAFTDAGRAWAEKVGAKEKPEGPSVSGVALKAADTGRILMLQRGMEDGDPAAGTWELPGGHHEDGDLTSLHAGIREWQEEVGQEFPGNGVVHHTWTSPNGVYQGHVVVIPSEKDLSMKDGRVVPNPDDPKGDNHEQAAWWDIDHARKNPALREELKTGTPWKEIAKAGTEKTASDFGLRPAELPETTIGPLYHGTTHDRAEEIQKGGFAGNAERQGVVYLTPHPDLAMKYAKTKADQEGAHPAVLKVDAVHGVSAHEVGFMNPDYARQAGAHYMDKGPEVVVLDPNAIHGISRHAKTASSWDALSYEDDQPGFPRSSPGHSNSQNPGSTGFATSQDPASWNQTNTVPDHLLPSGSYEGSLHEEPEGALPFTDGADDEGGLGWIPPHVREVPDTHSEISDIDSSMTPNSFHGSVQDIVSQFQMTAGAQAIQSGESKGESHSNGDIAAVAQAHLKTALKEFNFPEQQELINEGMRENARARNFNDLQIGGTHYEALSRALGIEDDDPEELFS